MKYTEQDVADDEAELRRRLRLRRQGDQNVITFEDIVDVFFTLTLPKNVEYFKELGVPQSVWEPQFRIWIDDVAAIAIAAKLEDRGWTVIPPKRELN